MKCIISSSSLSEKRLVLDRVGAIANRTMNNAVSSKYRSVSAPPSNKIIAQVLIEKEIKNASSNISLFQFNYVFIKTVRNFKK